MTAITGVSLVLSGLIAPIAIVVAAPLIASVVLPSSPAAASGAGALTISKSVDPANAMAAGGTETSTFTVTNTGNVPLTGVGVTDTQPLPTGDTAPATPTCTGLTNPSDTCTDETTVTLAVGQVATFTTTYTVTQTDMDSGTTITDTAFASGTTPSPSSTLVDSPTTTGSFGILESGSIHVTKESNLASVDSTTQTITYTFTATNTGNVTLSDVGIYDTQITPNTDTLTTGPSCTGLTTPTAGCSGNAVTLAVGQTATFTATLKVNQSDLNAGSIADSATGTGLTPLGGAATTNTAMVTVPATQTGALTISKSVDPANAMAAGGTETSTFTVTNTGNVPLTGVGVTDTQPLPTGDTAPATPTCTGLTNPSDTCTDETTVTLAVGQVATFTTTYTVTQTDMDSGTTITDTAFASGTTPSPSSTLVDSPTTTGSFGILESGSIHVTKESNLASVDSTTQTITYTFTATNTGNVTLSDVGIYDTQITPNTDTLTTGPSCTGLTTPTAGCSGNAVTLAVGQTATFTATLKVNQSDLNAGSIADSATGTGLTPLGGAATTNTAMVTVPATQTGALTISKSVDPANAMAAGGTETSTFTVTNTGNVPLTGVGVTDTQPLPTGDTAPATPTCTGLTNPSDTCTDETTVTLAVGQVATFTTTYTVTQTDMDSGTTITDTAFASGTTPSPSSTLVDSPTTTGSFGILESGSIHVTKESNLASVDSTTQTITYTFTATNTGNVTLSDVGIYDTQITPNTDTLTTGPSCTGLTTPTAGCSGNAVTLAVGQTATFTATLKVNQSDLNAGSIADSATGTGLTPLGGAATTNTAMVTVPATQTGALTISKSVDPANAMAAGGTETSTFTVTNTGNVPLTGVGVTDTQPLPTGDTAPATPTCTGLTNPSDTCTDETTVTLAVGQVATFTTTYTVTQTDMDSGTTITDTAFASGTTPSPSSTLVDSPTTTGSFGITQSPYLEIEKSGSPLVVTTVGQVVTYTFTVTNSGNVTMTDVGVSDTQMDPATDTLTTAPTCTGITNPTGLTCTGDATVTLDVGQIATFTATATVNQNDLDAGQMTDSATSTGTPPSSPPFTTPAPAPFKVIAMQTLGLTITKSASPSSVNMAGQVITSTIYVTNTGNVTMTNVAVTDVQTVGTGTAPTAPTCESLATPTGTCSGTTTSLVPGQVATFTTTYVVTQADINADSPLEDSATAHGTPPSEPIFTTPIPGTATTPVVATPGLSIVKSSAPTTVSATGQVVTYSFTITNTGNVTLADVSVDDTQTSPVGDQLASGPSCPRASDSMAPGATVVCTATARVTQSDLDAGGVFDTATASGTYDQTLVSSLPSTCEVHVLQSPTLFLLTSAGIGFFTEPGEEIPYSFMVINTGNVTLSRVSVTADLKAVSRVICPGTVLAPGATMICTARYETTTANFRAGDVELSSVANGQTTDARRVTSNISGVVVPAIKKTVEVTG